MTMHCQYQPAYMNIDENSKTKRESFNVYAKVELELIHSEVNLYAIISC